MKSAETELHQTEQPNFKNRQTSSTPHCGKHAKISNFAMQSLIGHY